MSLRRRTMVANYSMHYSVFWFSSYFIVFLLLCYFLIKVLASSEMCKHIFLSFVFSVSSKEKLGVYDVCVNLLGKGYI